MTAEIVAGVGLAGLLASGIMCLIGAVRKPESTRWLITCITAGLVFGALAVWGGATADSTGTRKECGVVIIADEPEYVCIEVEN